MKPLGIKGLEKVKKIVSEKQCARINGVFVDLFTASTIINVYNAVNDVNKEKLLNYDIVKVASICFKLVK